MNLTKTQQKLTVNMSKNIFKNVYYICGNYHLENNCTTDDLATTTTQTITT